VRRQLSVSSDASDVINSVAYVSTLTQRVITP